MNNEGAIKYYKELNGSKIICVDFDNTICLDEWPWVGPLIPGAIDVLKSLVNAGHKLIIYTQRSCHYPICCQELVKYSKELYDVDVDSVDLLTPAIKICNDNGVRFWDINQNTVWEYYTHDNSRKVFMDYLIDDHVVGTKRLDVTNNFGEVCHVVDWFEIDRWCLQEGLYKDSALKYSYNDYLQKFKDV